MKTASLKHKGLFAAVLLTGAQIISAAGFLSLDADVRYVNTDFATSAYTLKTFGVVARQVIADESADRWVLYSQVEVMNNFSDADIHQMYAMFKGPMGKWNISAGRLLLPYGLLSGFSTDHVPFSALIPYTLGIESDNGVMASGTVGMIDYALAITQGGGIFDGFPQQGLATGRLGMTLDESGDFVVGLSAAAGSSENSHAGQVMVNHLMLGSLDFTGTRGRTTLRSEISVGLQNEDVQVAGFIGADFTALSWLELNAAISAVRQAEEFHHAWGFIGTTFITNYLLLKGGYKYVHFGPIDHQITLMAYKQFTFNF